MLLVGGGWGGERDSGRLSPRHFTERYQVIAIDLPGFGDSSKPAASYDVGTQVERVAAFTQALNIQRLHIVGNSMGGHISALYAARYPEQVLSVGLLANAGVTAPQKSQLIEILERGDANPLVVKNPEDFERLLEFVFVEVPYLPTKVKQHLAEKGIANSAHNEQIFAQLINRYLPLEPELPKIQAPTLVLWGEHDRALHVSSAEAMRPLLRKPTIVVMPNTGHAPMIERPTQSAQHYQAFLDANSD